MKLSLKNGAPAKPDYPIVDAGMTAAERNRIHA